MTERAVFINCPFSLDYQQHFRAIVFTVIRSGFRARSALEADDASENRFSKICSIISKCRYAIHDISKTESDPGSGLPRFNMPLELGVFLGAKKYGSLAQRRKKCIIFDRKPFRYQKFISDLAGQDIHSHDGKISKLVTETASWLRDEAQDPIVPGGQEIFREFNRFTRALPKVCKLRRLAPEEITYQDYRHAAATWIVADSS